MIEFLNMVTTRPMIMDQIMDGLSATDSSSLLYALRISDPSPTMLSYLDFVRDFPEEKDTITDYVKHGYKIVFMGEGLKRLADRIEKPYRHMGINGDTICIAVLVVPTISSIRHPVPATLRHLTAVKKPNENGVSILYQFDCEGIFGLVVKMMSTFVSEEMSRDLRVWNTDSDGMETFKYVYERAPTLMETTVPAMMYELTDVASEELANVGIPYYDFTGSARGIARGWRKKPEVVIPPLQDGADKKYIIIELPIVETDRLMGTLPHHGYFFMGGGSYQCRTWRGGRCYCTDLTKVYFRIPIMFDDGDSFGML